MTPTIIENIVNYTIILIYLTLAIYLFIKGEKHDTKRK